MEHASPTELDHGLTRVLASPRDRGRLELIVRRPAVDEREVLVEGQLDRDDGLVGDSWKARGSRMTDDGSAHPDMQLNVMNARVAALLARAPDRWALAGDQLYVDLDLSEENLPAGTRLRVGESLIEVTAQPHLGCKKFSQRFGVDALRWVNSDVGRPLRLRGLNAKVVEPGTIRRGDLIEKA